MNDVKIRGPVNVYANRRVGRPMCLRCFLDKFYEILGYLRTFLETCSDLYIH